MRRNKQIERENRLLTLINEHQCVEAASELMEESTLADLVENHSNWYVRRESLKNRHLRDEKVIEKACFDENYMVRREAVNHLENQDLLVYISRNDPDALVRISCIRRIKNKDIAVYAARHDPHWRVRQAAIEEIGDVEILSSLLKDERNAPTHDMIMEKISSKS